MADLGIEKFIADANKANEEWNASNVCKRCGIADGKLSTGREYHDDCKEKILGEEKESAEKKSHDNWLELIKTKHEGFAMDRGAGLRHSVCTTENYIGEISVALEWLNTDCKDNLLIQSERSGNGKTHIAVAILKKYAQLSEFPARRRPLFVQFTEMMQFIRSSFDSDEMTETEIIDFFCAPELLIIDDLGAEKVSDYSASTLYVILNNRYLSNKPVLVTTNESSETLTEKYGSRIVSRIASGMIQKVEGRDNRITKAVKYDYTGLDDSKRTLKSNFTKWRNEKNARLSSGVFSQ